MNITTTSDFSSRVPSVKYEGLLYRNLDSTSLMIFTCGAPWNISGNAYDGGSDDTFLTDMGTSPVMTELLRVFSHPTVANLNSLASAAPADMQSVILDGLCKTSVTFQNRNGRISMLVVSRLIANYIVSPDGTHTHTDGAADDSTLEIQETRLSMDLPVDLHSSSEIRSDVLNSTVFGSDIPNSEGCFVASSSLTTALTGVLCALKLSY